MSDAVAAILEVLRQAAENTDYDLDEKLDPLIERCGWPVVRDVVFAALESDEAALWGAAAAAVWGAVLDKRDLDADRTIALVYFRLSPNSSHEDNLAWSIASKLKDAGYLSSYDPHTDPKVLAHLKHLKGS